jgi:NAD(P)-dependent dehydrogenase (short-subunit alcohol dehydrogenase family)
MAQIGSRAGRSANEIVDDQIQAVPLGRMVVPEDIANVFLFLASEQSAFITGATVTCDGGSILV